MVKKIDLRKLSAPIESLRPELEAAYEHLDKKWQEIAETLSKLPIPGSVSYETDRNPYTPEDFRCLEWKKWKGKKRICVVLYTFNPNGTVGPDHDEDTTPYDEWSGEQKVEMLNHVPDFFKAAELKVKEFIAKATSQEVSNEISS